MHCNRTNKCDPRQTGLSAKCLLDSTYGKGFAGDFRMWLAVRGKRPQVLERNTGLNDCAVSGASFTSLFRMGLDWLNWLTALSHCFSEPHDWWTLFWRFFCQRSFGSYAAWHCDGTCSGTVHGHVGAHFRNRWKWKKVNPSHAPLHTCSQYMRGGGYRTHTFYFLCCKQGMYPEG
jgi:hypothetical protein